MGAVARQAAMAGAATAASACERAEGVLELGAWALFIQRCHDASGRRAWMRCMMPGFGQRLTPGRAVENLVHEHPAASDTP